MEDCAERLRAYFATRRPGPVVAAFLFGSQATGRAVRGGDVDVAVVLDPTTRGIDSFSLRVDLSGDLVGVLHANEVDVLVLDEAPPPGGARPAGGGVCTAETRKLCESSPAPPGAGRGPPAVPPAA